MFLVLLTLNLTITFEFGLIFWTTLGARSNSQRLRSDVDNLVTQCANDMWSSWNTSNTALQQRVTETTEAHNKLQSHLSKTMQEIYDQVCTYFMLLSYVPVPRS